MLWPSPPWESVTYWSLDLETGGFDPGQDPILSVGMVPVREGGIRLGEGWSTLVRPEEAERIDPRSIRAHHLLPGEVRAAPPVATVLAEVDRRLRQGALLVHHAALDVRFLRRAYARHGMRWPAPPVVDTVALLIKAARRARFLDPNAEPEPDVNLLAARRRHGLPDYGQHDALVDAIAAAELFLVLRRLVGARRLRDLT
ncbi:MAG TPA: 3'-5' exonuclease [Anaeromyxobacter sp.]